MKTRRLFLSAFVMVGCLGATSRAALLSDYTFDNNANDIKGGINGTLHGTAAITSDSMIGGGSLILANSGTGQNYVNITSSAYPNNIAGRATGSATFWMKGGNGNNGNGAGQYNCVIGFNGTGSSMFEINSQGNSSKVDLWDRSQVSYGSYTPASAAGAFQDGSWHQVTVTWNTTTGVSGSGNAVFYIDGVLNRNDNGSGSTWTSSTIAGMAAWSASMTIGTAENSTSGYSGQLDDVAIWSTQLTATQASAVYHVGKDLHYNAKDIDTLFTIFAGGTGSSGATSDGKTWSYTTGLSGSAGSVVNGGLAVILDGSGNGVLALPSNILPSVSITTPTNGAGFVTPVNIGITATASDSDGTVTNVAFYQGASLIGQKTNSPYTVTWSNVAVGDYSLTAVAYDNSGAASTSAVVAIAVTAPPPPPVLLSCYPLDGNANDLVYGINGTLQGSPSYVAGRVGSGALQLNGTSQFVLLATNAYPNNTAGRATGSATFWMKSTSSGSYNAVIGGPNPLAGFPFFEINLQGNTSKMDMWTRTGTTYTYTPISAVGAFNNGSWHQVTIAWQATTGAAGTGTSAFYIDGALNASGSLSANNNWDSSSAATMTAWPSPVRIGSAEGSDYFNGTLDDVAIWGTPLTAAQAAAMYNVGLNLNYNAKDINVLFTVFAGGSGSSGATSDGKTWSYTTGLSGSAGSVVNGGAAVVLDGSGNGVAGAGNTPPTVSITQPTNGAFFAALTNIVIMATAADSDGTVTNVAFYQGSTLLGQTSTSPYSNVWTSVAKSNYDLTAVAYDNAGAVTTSAVVQIQVGANLPPTVSITQPTNGAVFTAPATIVITATAADSDGTVTNVAFYQGNTLLGRATTNPYSNVWTGVAAGYYALTASACDDGGAATTSAVVTIHVQNVSPPLLSDYPFDTNATNLVDASTSGTLTNGASITASDRAIGAGALVLDGVNDYVDITANGAPNSLSALENGSVSFWVKAGCPTNFSLVLAANQVGFKHFEVIANPSNIGLWVRGYQNSNRDGTSPSMTPTSGTYTNWYDNTWHQVTVAWTATTGNQGTGTAEWYDNGTLVKSVTGQGNWDCWATFSPWNTSMTIGCGEGLALNPFAGKLDDVAVWGDHLTATQAKAVYTIGHDAMLSYNARDIAALFALFASGQDSTTNTSDKKKWMYATSLTGNAGDVVGNHSAVILDGSGNGVRLVAVGTVFIFR